MVLKGLWNFGRSGSMNFIKIIDKMAEFIFFSTCGSKLNFLIVFYLDLDSYGQSTKLAICVSGLRLNVMFSHYPKCRILTNMCISKAAYTAYLMSIQVYKINSNPVGKYSDLQHCMHGHDASLIYQVLR